MVVFCLINENGQQSIQIFVKYWLLNLPFKSSTKATQLLEKERYHIQGIPEQIDWTYQKQITFIYFFTLYI